MRSRLRTMRRALASRPIISTASHFTLPLGLAPQSRMVPHAGDSSADWHEGKVSMLAGLPHRHRPPFYITSSTLLPKSTATVSVGTGRTLSRPLSANGSQSTALDRKIFSPQGTIKEQKKMDMKLELVPVPVTDIDRAKTFYVEKLGFNVDHDTRISDTVRIVQLTPAGSACSIVIGTGMGEISEMQTGSVKGLHLVVGDVREARDMLTSRGVEVGEVIEYPQGIKFVGFSDPDVNSWLFQEMPWRASEVNTKASGN